MLPTAGRTAVGIFFIKTTKFCFCRGSTIEVIFMTEEQKSFIEEHRRLGEGYKVIGKLMGISENTIKTYCRRNGLGGNLAQSKPDDNHRCKYCGARIKQIPGRKTKKFCSDYCRNHWWNGHLNMVKRKVTYKLRCFYCGKQFIVYGNKNRKYCSHECYIKDRFGGDNRE